MKRKILLIILLLAALSLPQESYAAETNSFSVEGEISPCADIIQTKYRSYNNKLQYRRWNQTKGYWVDPDWIDM